MHHQLHSVQKIILLPACAALRTLPLEKDLRKIADNCGDSWKSLLSYVGLKNRKIQEFKSDENTLPDACFQGLVFWLGRNADKSDPVDWSTLLTAMEEADMTGDAQEWRQKIIERYAASLDKPSGAGQSGNVKTPIATPGQDEPSSNVPTSATAKVLDRMHNLAQQFSHSFQLLTGVGENGRLLGRGSYGSVYEIEWRKTHCAAKCIHELEVFLEGIPQRDSQKFIDDFTKECLTWSKLSHPHIVQFLGIHIRPGSNAPILLMEKMDTSLRTLLEEHQREDLPLADKVFILRQVAQGLAYLHGHIPALVHHDLRPNNILLNRVLLRAKLTDFGMTRVVNPSGNARNSSIKGTLAFMSPEALENPPRYDDKLDVFSFGNVIIATLTHDWPDPGAAKTYVANKMVAVTEFERRQQHVIQFSQEESTSFLAMVHSCLEDLPNRRPTSLNLVDQMKRIEMKHPRLERPVARPRRQTTDDRRPDTSKQLHAAQPLDQHKAPENGAIVTQLLEQNLVQQLQRQAKEISLLRKVHQKPSSAMKTTSSNFAAKPSKPKQNKVVRSDQVRPSHSAVKMPNPPTPVLKGYATPVTTIDSGVYDDGRLTVEDEPVDEPDWPLDEDEPVDESDWPLEEDEPMDEPDWPLNEDEPVNEPDWPLDVDEPVDEPDWPLDVDEPVDEPDWPLDEDGPIDDHEPDWPTDDDQY